MERRLAELALEVAEEEGVGVGGLFGDELVLEPLLEAAEVDVLHGARALAGTEERVFDGVFGAETDAAEHLGDALRLGLVVQLLLLLAEHNDAVVVHAGLVIHGQLPHFDGDPAHLKNITFANHDALAHSRLRCCRR